MPRLPVVQMRDVWVGVTFILLSSIHLQTLARLVDFPTPFTPQKTTTYGRFCAAAHRVISFSNHA